MRRPRAPLFLKRGSYRKRRLRDAARMLPILGALLLLVPNGRPVARGVHCKDARTFGRVRIRRGPPVVVVAALLELFCPLGRLAVGPHSAKPARAGGSIVVLAVRWKGLTGSVADDRDLVAFVSASTGGALRPHAIRVAPASV